MDHSFTDQTLELVAARFKVLAEPTRLRILDALREGPRTVGGLVEELDTGQANVSKHLAVLRRHHLVTRRKEGVRSFYSIAEPAVFELCDLVCDSLERELDARRRALRGE
ncbi:MAG TPA: metalloregulator ArsR/SmtB family transcription factor [Gemmatimonadota bacterium]|nr:metalloregulator ArsR/SmtB family transcription factor [Gemmatimonadota bacterium]